MMKYLKSIFLPRFPVLFLQFGLLIGIFIPGQLFAQLDAYKFGEIISEGNVKIELLFVKPKIRCGSNAKEWKFKLKTQGVATIKSTQRYLTWKLVTVNCENNDRIQRVFSVDLKSMRFEDGVSIGSKDWGFTAQSVEDGILDARLQSTDNTEKDENLSRSDALSVSNNTIQSTDDLEAMSSEPVPSDAKYFGDIISQDGINAELWFLKPESPCSSSNDGWKYWVRLNARNVPSINSNLRHLNWALKVVRCDNYVIQKVFSIDLASFADNTTLQRRLDWEFQADSIAMGILNARLSPSKSFEKDIELGSKILSPPDSIAGNRETNSDKATTLRILGRPLPPNARWVWYTSQCGQGIPVHTGAEFTILPKETTVYWVRSELGSMASDCKEVQVVVRGINIDPKEVVLEDGTDRICSGSSKKLQVKGGQLGYKAKWVWYKNLLNPASRIAEDSLGVLQVAPTETTTYFVRAEGPTNQTRAVKLTIFIEKAPNSPGSIIPFPADQICKGQEIRLTVSGDSLNSRYQWIWFATNSTGKEVDLGTGKYITGYPSETLTYSVFASGPCGNTTPASIKIQVKQQTENPIPAEIVFERDARKVTLKNNGGVLGDSAKWVWYQGVFPNRTIIGEGAEIVLRATNATRVYLQGIGACGSSPLMEKYIPGVEKFSFIFFDAGVITNAFNTAGLESGSYYLTLGTKYFYVKATLNGGSVVGKTNTTDPYGPTFESNDSKLLNYPVNDGTYYVFNENKVTNIGNYCAGVMAGGKTIRVYLGGGYGFYDLLWGVDTYNYSNNSQEGSYWAVNTNRSFTGACIESGIFARVGSMNIMAGLNAIYSSKRNKDYISGHIGIGYLFN